MPLYAFAGGNLSSSGLTAAEWEFECVLEWVFAAVRANISNGCPKLFPAVKVLSTFVVGEVAYSKLFLILSKVFSNSSSRLQSVDPSRNEGSILRANKKYAIAKKQ